jgi:hypothetical protein
MDLYLECGDMYSQKCTDQNQRVRLVFTLVFWIMIAIIGRIMPHPPNVTPLTSLSLFAGTLLSRRAALLVTIITLVSSDIFLAIIYHFPFVGMWSLFTYSGFAAVTLLGSQFSIYASLFRYLGFISIASIGYWIWTNLGVWLTSGMYSISISGFVHCYLLALPFLRNALLGDWSWMILLWGLIGMLKKFPFINSLWLTSAN